MRLIIGDGASVVRKKNYLRSIRWTRNSRRRPSSAAGWDRGQGQRGIAEGAVHQARTAKEDCRDEVYC